MSASSDNQEFPAAHGGEIEALIELGHGWQLKLGLQRIWDQTQKKSRVCRTYTPLSYCQIEDTRNKVHSTGFRAAVVRSLFAVSHVAVKLGGGFSLNQLAIESSTGLVSHLRGDIYPPSGAQAGILGRVTLDITPAPGVGLAIRLGAIAHWVDFNSCSGTRYDPFCTPATFREFQVGVAYSLPR